MTSCILATALLTVIKDIRVLLWKLGGLRAIWYENRGVRLKLANDTHPGKMCDSRVGHRTGAIQYGHVSMTDRQICETIA
jgi:hypothetical protein